MSCNFNFLQRIYQNGTKKLKSLLDQTKDPSIYCSIVNILAEFIRNNETISTDIILNIIWFFKNNSNILYLLRIIESLNGLTKTSQSITLFVQEKIFTDFIFRLQSENSLEIQLNILLILQTCANNKDAVK